MRNRLKAFPLKLNTALLTLYLTFKSSLPAFAGGGQPSLNEVDSDVKNLLNMPKWFKKIFYGICAILIFFMIARGIINYINASTEMEAAEAKKSLKKTIIVAIAIPIVMALIIALVSWRLEQQLNF